MSCCNLNIYDLNERLFSCHKLYCDFVEQNYVYSTTKCISIFHDSFTQDMFLVKKKVYRLKYALYDSFIVGDFFRCLTYLNIKFTFQKFISIIHDQAMYRP